MKESKRRIKDLKLYESDFRITNIVWENEPIGSGELVQLCKERFDWKKSTTYTVLKKLCERGVLQNKDSMVTSLVSKEEVQIYESNQLMQRAFGDSLPQFITAFMNDRKLSKKEAEELKKMIDSYKED